MKNKWIMKAGVAAALIGFSTMVQATPITGYVNFEGGTATWNATQILSFGGTTIVANDPGSLPTGTYFGTQNTVATFTPFVFSPSFVPNNPVWTFNYGGDTFSFNLTSESVIVNQPNSLLIQGLGTLFFQTTTGGNNIDDPTVGAFTLTATGEGVTFGFTAGNNTNIPDGGATVMLLGAALSAMGLLRRKLIA